MGIDNYNQSAALNTNLAGINTGEGMARDDVNDAIRQVMADIASGITGANRLLTADNVVNPIGNGADTRSRVHLIAADAHNDIREYTFSLGTDFSHGTAASGSPSEKVVVYVGANMLPGSFKGWAANMLLHISPSVAVEYANTVEIDIDNYNGNDFGSGIGAAGLAAPSVWGLTVNGANTASNTVTGAIGLISSATGPIYERGFVAGPNSCKQASFDDYAAGTYSYRDLGTHSVGMELRGTYSTAAVRIPNNAPIVCRNTANTADVNLIKQDGSSNVIIGDATNATNIVIANNLIPVTNLTTQIGTAALQMTAVYAERIIHLLLHRSL